MFTESESVQRDMNTSPAVLPQVRDKKEGVGQTLEESGIGDGSTRVRGGGGLENNVGRDFPKPMETIPVFDHLDEPLQLIQVPYVSAASGSGTQRKVSICKKASSTTGKSSLGKGKKVLGKRDTNISECSLPASKRLAAPGELGDKENVLSAGLAMQPRRSQ